MNVFTLNVLLTLVSLIMSRALLCSSLDTRPSFAFGGLSREDSNWAVSHDVSVKRREA